jgi:hypothetical protein
LIIILGYVNFVKTLVFSLFSHFLQADLAVHKKKVAEVRDWLLSHLCLQVHCWLLVRWHFLPKSEVYRIPYGRVSVNSNFSFILWNKQSIRPTWWLNGLIHFLQFVSFSFTDMLVRDEPTRTCCGPQPSWAPKIKTLEKIRNIDFNFENQD